MRRLTLGVLAMMLVSSVALAEPEKGKGAGAGQKDDKGEKGEKSDAGSKAAADDDDDDAPVADGGKPVAGRRSPAQLAFRKAVWERRVKAIEAKVHKNGKHITEEQREIIRLHWLRVARLMRIRDLAQEDKNDAAVKRADTALEREEKNVETKLEKASAKTGGAK